MDELSEVGEGRWRKAARTSEAVSCSKQKGKLKRTESRGEIGAYEELETLLDLLETLRRVKVGDDEDSRESRGINIIRIVGDCRNPGLGQSRLRTTVTLRLTHLLQGMRIS